jgi:AcrR family transcriptional regulator
LSAQPGILAAVAEVIGEQGYAELTVRKVTRAAGLSRKTFYEHFPESARWFSSPTKRSSLS